MPLLNWLDKDEATKASAKSAYRLLEERADLSYGDSESDNLLIQGDNLEALKALLPFYAGKVKCIYIDPPYNTKSAFEHYDDNLEHSKWLSLIYPRLELLRELLSEDGTIWISIDDAEAHYFKVIADEIFGRNNFIESFIWKKSYGGGAKARFSVGLHEYIFCYSKNKEKLTPFFLPANNDSLKYYKFEDDKSHIRGPYRLQPLATNSMDARPNLRYSIHYNGADIWPEKQWQWSENRVLKAISDDEIVFREKEGKVTVSYKQYLKNENGETRGAKPKTIIDNIYTQHGSKESVILFGSENKFSFPKPEAIIQHIFEIGSEKGDLVLDSFIGSGTSISVAHKMNRRYIGIEIGEHAQTHCQPRLKKVVDGEQGGISKAVNWQGGGGFRFCQLGPTVFDEYGLLNSDIKFPTLAAHIWYIETKQPQKTDATNGKALSPLIGIHNGIAYFLLYNGILGDRRPNGGNVLTRKVLEHLEEILANTDPSFNGQRIVYGETSRLGEARLQQGNITFKQIPYDVKAL